MKYVVYEHPVTHKFAIVKLPAGFVEGDKLPLLDNERWFASREEVTFALPELLNRDE